MEKNRGSPQNVPPNNRIIVHNLPFETDTNTLKEYFSKYGTIENVEIPIVRNKPSGFGFVTFSTVEEATKANDPENQHTLEGRPLRTNFANKRERGGEKEEPKGKKLYVGKLPKETSDKELREYFGQFGKVEDAFLATVKYAPELNGFPQHKGYGFVSFENEEDANKAVGAKNHQFKGVAIFVKKALPQQEDKKGRKNREGKSGERRERPNREGGNREGGNRRNREERSPKEGGNDQKHGHKEHSHSPKEGGHKEGHKHGHKEHSHSPKEHSHDHKHEHKHSHDHKHHHDNKEGETQKTASPQTSKNENRPTKAVPKKSGLHYSVANQPVQVNPNSLVNPWKKIESTQTASTTDDYPTLGKGKAKRSTTSSPSTPTEEKGKQEVEKN